MIVYVVCKDWVVNRAYDKKEGGLVILAITGLGIDRQGDISSGVRRRQTVVKLIFYLKYLGSLTIFEQ